MAVDELGELFNTASQRATTDGGGKIFDRAADVAIAWSRALDSKKVPVRLRAQHALFDTLIYGKLRQALGGTHGQPPRSSRHGPRPRRSTSAEPPRRQTRLPRCLSDND